MRGFTGICAAIALTGGMTAHAQNNYPSRPVRVVVFVPAGGAADLSARVLSQKMSDQTGQTFVVDNRAGSGGVIATNLVSKATPDGYTLLQGGITTHGIGPHIYRNLPYDPVMSFEPIVLSTIMPVFMLSNTQAPVKNVKDVIALAKSKPGAMSWGSPGTGSAPHLVGELFKIVTGIPSPHIPYKGSGTGAPALAANEIPVFFDAVAGHQAFIRSGRVRALAVTSAKRVDAYPDVPTMKEAGLERIDGQVWYGLFAPAGTPGSAISKINAEANRALAAKDVKDRLTAASIGTAGSTPEEFGKFVRAELAKWGPVVKAAGVKVN